MAPCYRRAAHDIAYRRQYLWRGGILASADRARLRPTGYAAAAFACFATMGHGVACRAAACEASEGWWSQAGSNRRPLACHATALPAELWPRRIAKPQIRPAGMTLNHSSGPISSLFVVADVADDVGDVLVA